MKSRLLAVALCLAVAAPAFAGDNAFPVTDGLTKAQVAARIAKTQDAATFTKLVKDTAQTLPAEQQKGYYDNVASKLTYEAFQRATVQALTEQYTDRELRAILLSLEIRNLVPELESIKAKRDQYNATLFRKLAGELAK